MFLAETFGLKIVSEDSERDDLRYIAKGPITKQPGTIAYRIVLFSGDQGFVVYVQQFYDYPDLNSNVLYDGTYFNKEQFSNAVKFFGEKIANSAKCMDSLYREKEHV